MAEATKVFGELTGLVPARRLDLRGQTCPTTSGDTLRVLEHLAVGVVLEVVSDCYPARTTIPYHCDKRGYR
jgi:TusA-related sulfurtransferase